MNPQTIGTRHAEPESQQPWNPDDQSATRVLEIVQQIFSAHQGEPAIQLWDETPACGGKRASCTLVIREPGVVRELLLHPDLFRLVDAYLHGRLDVEGDFERLFELGDFIGQLELPVRNRLELLRMALALPATPPSKRPRTAWKRRHARNNSRETIAHHYDRGNDFFRLWLDPEMVYSCAYFASEEQPLAEAQRDKLEYLCRKLRLRPGQHLLDIGCGWGALAIHSARHHGAIVHGITLSEEQFRHARERVKREGLAKRVAIELRDYRDLPEKARYDRVVSVGMFEHIGIRNFPRYFTLVRKVLRPGGLFLNHGITSDTDWKPTHGARFINSYIFPDGELARVSTVTAAMEEAGFEILDVENLRPHYTLTLRHWVRNLEAARDAAIRASSEVTWRLWRLYLAGCAFNFDRGGIGLHQILAGPRRQLQPVPLRRDDLYRDARDASVEG